MTDHDGSGDTASRHGRGAPSIDHGSRRGQRHDRQASPQRGDKFILSAEWGAGKAWTDRIELVRG